MKVEETPWLHIRGQFTYHGEATIRGTTEGLMVLKETLDKALVCGRSDGLVFSSDGEGYSIAIERHSMVKGIGRPTYADEEARALANLERDYLVQETKAMRIQNKEAIEALIWCRQNGNPHKP